MSNDTFSPPHGRLSDVDFGEASNNPFDGSYNNSLNVSFNVIYYA